MGTNLSDRSTTDLVVLIFSTLIASVLILLIIGTVILKLKQPDIDTTRVSESVSQTINVIVGALVGFIGGRALGRNELIENDK